MTNNHMIEIVYHLSFAATLVFICRFLIKMRRPTILFAGFMVMVGAIWVYISGLLPFHTGPIEVATGAEVLFVISFLGVDVFRHRNDMLVINQDVINVTDGIERTTLSDSATEVVTDEGSVIEIKKDKVLLGNSDEWQAHPSNRKSKKQKQTKVKITPTGKEIKNTQRPHRSEEYKLIYQTLRDISSNDTFLEFDEFELKFLREQIVLEMDVMVLREFYDTYHLIYNNSQIRHSTFIWCFPTNAELELAKPETFQNYKNKPSKKTNELQNMYQRLWPMVNGKAPNSV